MAGVIGKMGRPEASEAAPYYFTYIDKVPGDDVVGVLARSLDETLAFLGAIPEEKSLHRYAAGKWSIREAWNHVNDGERLFAFRAFWFARGFDSPLPSFDQDVAVKTAGADQVSWAEHVEEFRRLRLASLSFFQGLPDEAWARTGVASGYTFTVRAMAYITAGHALHHVGVLKERYL